MNLETYLSIRVKAGTRSPLPFFCCATVLLGLSSSCSKSNSLSDDQKTAIRETMDSSGRAYSVAKRNGSSVGSANDLNTPLARSNDSQADQMAFFLRQRIQDKKCKIMLNSANTPAGPLADTLSDKAISLNDAPTISSYPKTFSSLKVTGNSNCPVSLNFKISTQSEPTLGRWVTTLDYTYRAETADYKPMNDVDTIDLTGGMRLNGLNTGRTRTDVNMHGKIHSQARGDIQLSLSGSLDGASDRPSGELLWRFDFSDFFAEFKQAYDSGSVKYTLNDEDIGREDFESYFSRGGEPFFYGSNPSRIR